MGTPWKHVLKPLQLASFGNPVGQEETLSP